MAQGPGTLKLDWGYLEHNEIDRNELQNHYIKHKKAQEQIGWKFETFWKIWMKKIQALFSTQRPPDDWPDALDHLAIGLAANKCTKLEKISEILLLSLGLSYMKIPLC